MIPIREKRYRKKEQYTSTQLYGLVMYLSTQPTTLVIMASILHESLFIIDLERHLEKTPIGYIQWRFQDGHDREYIGDY
jgi:hypothetical protein